MAQKAQLQRFRRLFVPGAAAALESAGSLEGAGGLESKTLLDDPRDRIARAREAMRRVIKDRFGGDDALLNAVEQLSISAEEAVAVLTAAEENPSDDQMTSLEAIVAFDGTRPSFLVKNQAIDFTSSYNTGDWIAKLEPYLDCLTQQISCVGRVEVGQTHIGTAFLVTPTLAITNRHVAQSIAGIGDGKMQIKADVFLDFGREHWDGKTSYDRRKVEALLFAGKDPIIDPINHHKLDLAVIRLGASQLADNWNKRHLNLGKIGRPDFEASPIITTIGYPGAAELFVPKKFKTQYDEVLARLLEGDGGAKRFAPGNPMATDGVFDLADWTVMHDATTINGNSGSPVGMFQPGTSGPPFMTVGLHYGGAWGSERVNWAQLLGGIGTLAGYGGSQTFAEFCAAEGIAL